MVLLKCIKDIKNINTTKINILLLGLHELISSLEFFNDRVIQNAIKIHKGISLAPLKLTYMSPNFISSISPPLPLFIIN